MTETAPTHPAKLPGLGAPVGKYFTSYPAFPSAVRGWLPPTYTVRERAMMAFVMSVVDKDGWYDKVFNEEIVNKWREDLKEAVRLGWRHRDDPRPAGNDANDEDDQQQRPSDDDSLNTRVDSEFNLLLTCGFSDGMFEYCIDELRAKAELYKKIGFVEVLENHAAIFVSDNAVDDALREALIAAVKPLEDVPDADKDWHPGSDGKVLDLVHPSLWPLVYGKTLATDHEISLDESLNLIGSGDVVPVPALPKRDASYYRSNDHLIISDKFQWLPAEVDTSDDGMATFKSYINNLHPSNGELYGVLGRLVGKFLPLWSATYDRVLCAMNAEAARERISFWGGAKDVCRLPASVGCKCEGIGCKPPSGWRPPGWEEDSDRAESEDGSEGDDEGLQAEWTNSYMDNHDVEQPEPEPFEPFTEEEVAEKYKTQGPWFGYAAPKGRLQVIVKLANIHLTPEKPQYDGGSWHIEGAFNERICATGLYYYDNENITPSHLSFRGVTDGEALSEALTGALQSEYSDHRQLESVFFCDPQGEAVIDVGSVLTKQGRLLAFPNVLQHCVEPFELADKSKPGHRKIVALFLVDPDTPVVSTANIPPQQSHWGTSGAALGSRMPIELQNMVDAHIECPYGWDEARKLREQLMEERSRLEEVGDKLLEQHKFNLCEH
ncbi:hypothetical protein Q8F55_004427 [Vanrija albida]|uniref:Fe2OG dioxygenase domain-containing protein n=1 Tax=Vanrija albida TaxID=181172 RepID=A0ABR3Q7J1_9TREE